jgi:Uma2 family endonuclease
VSTIPALLTFEEFEQLPGEPGKDELLDGELIHMPPATFRHAAIAKRFYNLLLTVLDDSRVWMETGYRIGKHWAQPDVSVIHQDQKRDDKYLLGAPLLAIEVLSPGNTARQIERKLTLYFETGAAEVWVVDDRSKTMTVYRKQDRQVTRSSTTEAYRSDLVGIVIPVSEVLA